MAALQHYLYEEDLKAGDTGAAAVIALEREEIAHKQNVKVMSVLFQLHNAMNDGSSFKARGSLNEEINLVRSSYSPMSRCHNTFCDVFPLFSLRTRMFKSPERMTAFNTTKIDLRRETHMFRS